jgi:hypothetical protein
MSDADQAKWMEYIFMQKPKPANTKGVAVHLTATDPNGNFQDIGTATSDGFGNFAITWTPPVPGLYTVTAKFDGSESYYESESGTSFVVGDAAPAPAVTPTPTSPLPTQPSTGPTPTPVSPTPVSPSPTVAPPPAAATPVETYIAIGVAVIVVIAVAAALVLRKRK